MIKNRTIFTGDNLDILRGMDSESIDLIYLDPPFNSNKHYSAPIGSKAAGAEFKDAWTFEDTDAAWWGVLADEHESLYRVIDAAGAVGGKGDKAYLIYMAMRLLEMYRVLKPTGSIYLHCDPTMSHSLKMMLDAIFEKKNFRNEITWERNPVKGAKATSKQYGRNVDILLFYSKSSDYYFQQIYKPYDLKSKHNKWKFKDKAGRVYSRDNPLGDYSEKSIEKFEKEGRIYTTKNNKKQLIRYLDEQKGLSIGSVWNDIKPINQVSKERLGYPTQKPIALLKRILSSSCPPDGFVLDPFCGCATTCIASEDLSLQWVGIDISTKAIDLVKLRAQGRFSLFPTIHRTDIPARDAPPRSKNVKHTLFGFQEGCCNGCKISFPYSNFTIDHIIPTSKGGADTNGNLQLLCNHCNSVKGNRPMEYLLAQLKNK